MTYSATAPVKLLAGTAAAPGVTFTSDTDTGLFSPGANQVAVTTGGVQRLLIGSDGSITPSGSLLFPLGSATSPSIAFTGDTDTGLYSPGANQVAIATAGTGRLFVNSTGFVGINTASPVNLLTVSGTGAVAKFIGSGPDVSLAFQNSSSNAGYLQYVADNLALWTANTERLRITSTGLVGIGTTTPTGLFTVAASAPAIDWTFAGNTAFKHSIESTGYATSPVSGNHLAIKVASGSGTQATVMHLNGAGQVGIGSTLAGNANNRLLIRSESASAITNVLLLNNGAANNNAGQGVRINMSGISEADSHIRYSYIEAATESTTNGHYLAFGTNLGGSTPVERLRIDSSGSVSIGTATNPTTGGFSRPVLYMKQFTSPNSGFAGIQLEASGDESVLGIGYDGTAQVFAFDTSYRSTGARRPIIFKTNGFECLRIDSIGRLLVGTSSTRSNLFAGNAALPAYHLVEGALDNGRRTSAFVYGAGSNSGPIIVLAAHSSNSIGGVTAVTSGWETGTIDFQGADGTNFVPAARIQGIVDGTPGANDMPGRLVFSTTADGASTPTERLRIDSTGQIEAGSLGTAAAPVWSFLADPDTGLYSPGANQIAIATSGTGRLFVDTTAVTSTLPVLHPLGAAATPSISFTGDLDTGVYSPGADQVAISTAGTQKFAIDSFDGNPIIETSYPLVRPTLDLNFAATRRLDPRVTFSRSSTATVTDQNGVIRSAAVNVPRFDHNPTTGESLGLLVEEARTNSLLSSSDLTTASWTLSSVTRTANSTTAPDGTNTAVKIASTTGTFLSALEQSSVSVTAVPTTFSCYAKAAEASWFCLAGIQSGEAIAYFNLATGALGTRSAGSAHSITSVGNGWYRCSVTCASASSTRWGFFPGSADNTLTPAPIGNGVHVWGPQLEAGAFPTSYIPTVASTVTRAADVAAILGANFSSWYNQSEGTLFASLRTNTPANVNNSLIQMTDGTSNNRIEVQQVQSGDAFPRVSGLFRTSNLTTASWVSQESGWTPNGQVVDKWALGFNSSGFSFITTYDSTPPSGTGSYPQNLTTFFILHRGTISRLTYWPIRLSNATLQTLTR